MRFQSALKRMETALPGDSPRIAADLGYFDQAHLTNESTQWSARVRPESSRIIWPIFPRHDATEFVYSRTFVQSSATVWHE
jgi:hypothetical protein